MAKNKHPGSAATTISRPPQGGALLQNAIRFMQSGMLGQARAQCEQVLRNAPGNADAHYMLGVIATRSNRFDDAAKHIAEALRLNPANPAGHNNLGVIHKRAGRLDEAIACFHQAIEQKRDYVEAHHNLGNALQDAGRAHEALASFDQAVALRPDFVASHNGRGNVLAKLGRHDEALQAFERAIALQPGHAEANNGKGNALAQLRRFGEALESFDAAIRIDPSDAKVHGNRGGALLALKQFNDAGLACAKALELDPQMPEAIETAAQAATGAKRYAVAAQHYARLVEVAPDYPFAKGNLLHARMLCCDWEGIDELSAAIRADLEAARPAAEPFGYQGTAESELDLLRCARIYSEHDFPAWQALAPQTATPRDSRITIGYVCGEFRKHATTILMCGVYEAHDRSRFRLVAFDNGGSDGSEERRRIEAAFDEVVDIAPLSDADAAAAIRARSVDVLVNLNGYYGEGRNGVFALRPAPVQVNYLGFPGTLGSSCMDYIVADGTAIPPASREFYVEQVVSLPDCYQANDDKRSIAQGAKATRADFGLPDAAIVFCCFNNSYKITPRTFDSWMRILLNVPGSALWLLENSPEVGDNLRRSARERGIAAERLVFAGRLPPEEHLARHALADLFLDTQPYNAHTTASDALWAGLPLLTCTGSTFPGRVATSLLRAAGLGELVTASMDDYEALAVSLARDPQRLAVIRDGMKQRRRSMPLFDTAALTRHLETAYTTMVERQRSGLPAQAFDVGG